MNFSPSSRSIQTVIDRPAKPETQDTEQIISAILLGKYSWACVLMLRRMGYNPMDYIPYRTYKRIMDEQGHSKKNH
jgi:hypothetical protein